MRDISCRQLTPRDVPEVAHLLARAFADNPCYVWMHPRASTRTRDLLMFFERNLAWHLPLNKTWVAERAGRVLGTLMLEPPGGVQHGVARTLTHWVLPTLRDQGPRTVRRIAAADQSFRDRYRAITKSRDYWHLHAVAVHPDHQGSGVGTMLLRRSMHELANLRADPLVPVVLSTQRERNLPLYRRAGFELRGKHHIGTARDNFISWFMSLA